ncbi:MAG: T9SS type A sorting domain-containing protein [Bacteroidales bacterium]|jgi:hypothetical protein|nr:T9SS type A sorting domain-containing protein [Bacteroidales bacterium]
MKKLLLFAYLLSVIAFYGYSQNLSLSNLAGPIAPNTIIIQPGTPDSTDMTTFIYVKNIGTRAINVFCKKSELSLMDSIQLTMCWANGCYPPSTTVSPNAQLIEPGQTIMDFSGHYSRSDGKNLKSGESVVRWVFFTENDINDSASVTIKYTSFPLGVEETMANQGVLSNSIPNPANEKATFSYTIASGSDGSFVVRNLVGSTMQTISLQPSNGKITLATADLADGIYFCSLLVKGKVAVTKKMVVRH